MPARSGCRPDSSTTRHLLRARRSAGAGEGRRRRAAARYISHMRSEDRWFWEALDELIAIGRVEQDAGAGVAHQARACTICGDRLKS